MTKKQLLSAIRPQNHKFIKSIEQNSFTGAVTVTLKKGYVFKDTNTSTTTVLRYLEVNRRFTDNIVKA